MAAAIFAPIRAESGEGPRQVASQNEKTSLPIHSTTPSPQTTSTQDRKRAWDVISDDKPRLFDAQVAPNSVRPQTPSQSTQHYGAPPPYSQTYTPHFQTQQQQGRQQPQQTQPIQTYHMPLRPGEQPPPPQSQPQSTPAQTGPQNATTLPPLREIVRRHTGAAPLSPLMTASPVTTSFENYSRGSVDNSPYSSAPIYDQEYRSWDDRRTSQPVQNPGSPTRPSNAGLQLMNPPVEFHGQAAQDQHRHPSYQSNFQPHPAQQQLAQQSHPPYGSDIHRANISVHPSQPLYGSVDQPQNASTQQPIAASAHTNPMGTPSQQTNFETRTGFSYPPVHQYPATMQPWPSSSNAMQNSASNNTSPTSARIPYTPRQSTLGHNELHRITEARRGSQASAPHSNRFGNGVQTGFGGFDLRLQLNHIKTSCADLNSFADFFLNRVPEGQHGLPPLEHLPSQATIESLLHSHGSTYRSLDTIRVAVMQAEQAQQTQIAAAQAFAEKQATQQAEAQPDSGAGPSSASLGGEVKKRRGRHAEGGQCHSCHASDTPEWRKGPDGARTLCNACGLHYAKMVRRNEKEKKETESQAPDSQSQSQNQSQGPSEYSWNPRASGSTTSSAAMPPLSRSDTSAATLVSVLTPEGDGSAKMSDVLPTGMPIPMPGQGQTQNQTPRS